MTLALSEPKENPPSDTDLQIAADLSKALGSKLAFTIDDLFDFEKKHWSELYENPSHAGVSFDEELELYELLDFDADGEDVDEDVDTFTGEILNCSV